MYSKVTRSDEYKRNLLDFVKREYGIEPIDIKPAKRGFYGETWKLITATAAFFVKVVYAPEHKPFYERSLPVVQHLCDHGIDFVGRIVKTTSTKLYSRFDGATIALFDWIEGENRQTDATKIEEYKMLAKVYKVPASGIFIASEDFTAKDANDFYERWSNLQDESVSSLLEKNRLKIEHRAKRLNVFSKICSSDTSGFFITHGDAGGNFLVGESNYIIDWDTAKLAPPERDAWFCVHWDWAMAGFRDALKLHGIGYELRNERFAYYCYWFFFYYLNAFLDAGSGVEPIEEFINGWMADNVKWADGI
jgi:thiamine kinase-like enzyme